MSAADHAAPGKVAAHTALQTDHGRQFARFLRVAGPECFSSLIEVRRIAAPGADVIVFSTQTGRPRDCVHEIRREETLAAVFSDTGARPQVFALRADFPPMPHLCLEEEELPRSLCLYDQVSDLVKLTWTPAAFLERVRHWLRHNSTGTLHAADQPLEPLLADSNIHFVFPPGILAAGASRHLAVVRDVLSGKNRTIVSVWANSAEIDPKLGLHVFDFKTTPQSHGIIRRAPKNLAELDDLTRLAGLPIAKELSGKLRTWQLAGVLEEAGKREMLILLGLPKQRETGTKEEATEHRAFLVQKSVHEIAHLLGVLANKSKRGMAEIPETPRSQLAKIPLQICQTHCSIPPNVAAELNGTAKEDKIVAAIGAGALGSQAISNLLRAGWGRWAIIDPDVFLPHNTSRHALDGYTVGHYKVLGMQNFADSMYPQVQTVVAIPDDVIHPEYRQTTDVLANAALVMDFSASLPAARHLSHNHSGARIISAFTSPNAESLVLLAEDRARTVRIDWLEMLHYRAVLNEASIGQTLVIHEGRFRYGNGCRDISAIIAQDDIALWAATSSRAIRQLDGENESAIRIYHRSEDGSVQLHCPAVTTPTSISLGDFASNLNWTIMFDTWLLEKLAAFRADRLPNETGGILLGVFDTQAKNCYIIDSLPSPPDSQEWPTSYIRGCEGLSEQVKTIQKRTAQQVNYVGEWHSHPDRCSTRPSGDDRKAYAWLIGHMSLETLPAIMLIVGENQRYELVTAVA